jgi:hypothetical protein
MARKPAAHRNCDRAARTVTCRNCGDSVNVRDCDRCPSCSAPPSHYYTPCGTGAAEAR